jgi:hypothetical protein
MLAAPWRLDQVAQTRRGECAKHAGAKAIVEQQALFFEILHLLVGQFPDLLVQHGIASGPLNHGNQELDSIILAGCLGRRLRLMHYSVTDRIRADTPNQDRTAQRKHQKLAVAHVLILA